MIKKKKIVDNFNFISKSFFFFFRLRNLAFHPTLSRRFSQEDKGFSKV